MLDAIADFWKPVKRTQAQTALKVEELQIGSSLAFGFVPQPSLSNRHFSVTSINTYKFGPDILTSFVLSQEKDAGASLIIADTNGEPYLALSRRISIADRNKIFNMEDIDAVLHFAEAKNILSKETPSEYKGWIAPSYKRELQSIRGQLFKGDHRAGLLTGQSSSDFMYSLLVSDNNEHALEIEEYDDGRTEIYATVYRRMKEVAEVSHPVKEAPARPDVKLVSNSNAPSLVEPAPKLAPTMGDGTGAALPEKTIMLESKQAEIAASTSHAAVQESVIASSITLPEFPSESVVKKELPVDIPEEKIAAISQTESGPAATFTASPTSDVTSDVKASEAAPKPAVIIQSQSQPFSKQEIKAVTKETSNFINESIDCELHVANKIIDEAIRNEMRINDVVRRVIGLPVSQQESVQIPVTLTDQDYALLAIRYGIAAGDHEAIKKRIIEDLGDFSGANKTKRAA